MAEKVLEQTLRAWIGMPVCAVLKDGTFYCGIIRGVRDGELLLHGNKAKKRIPAKYRSVKGKAKVSAFGLGGGGGIGAPGLGGGAGLGGPLGLGGGAGLANVLGGLGGGGAVGNEFWQSMTSLGPATGAIGRAAGGIGRLGGSIPAALGLPGIGGGAGAGGAGGAGLGGLFGGPGGIRGGFSKLGGWFRIGMNVITFLMPLFGKGFGI